MQDHVPLWTRFGDGLDRLVLSLERNRLSIDGGVPSSIIRLGYHHHCAALRLDLEL